MSSSSRDIYKLFRQEILLFDGAFGTELMNSYQGVLPEMANLEAPEAVIAVHENYRAAGARVITTNTFGLNEIKLAEFNLAAEKLEDIARAAVSHARRAARPNGFVAGSIGPLGKLIKPLGELSFDRALNIFKRSGTALANSGVDLLIVETMSDIHELKAALIAISELNLPVVCSMSFEAGINQEKISTYVGVTPEVYYHTVLPFQPAAIGLNCGGGPLQYLPVIKQLAKISELPILIQPNAGLPDERGNYNLNPAEFAEQVMELKQAGAHSLGGCCGTTPAHISALAEAAENSKLSSLKTDSFKGLVLTSRNSTVSISSDNLPAIIGERINPTGRKKMTRQLGEKNFQSVLKEAEKQLSSEFCSILDLNVACGHPEGAEFEAELMTLAVENLTRSTPEAIICLDSPSIEVLKAGLKACPGRALINSASGESSRLVPVLKLARKYRAAAICLLLDDQGIPDTRTRRLEILETIIETARREGLNPTTDLLFDPLTLTVASGQTQIREMLDTLTDIKARGLHSILGVSNVSHGMPARPVLTSSLLTLALDRGLNAAIINPYDSTVKAFYFAYLALAGLDHNGENFSSQYSAKGRNYGIESSQNSAEISPNSQSEDKISKFLFSGRTDDLMSEVQQLLKTGEEPQTILNQRLIPAINQVGEKYSDGSCFLPQLLAAADSMKFVTNYLRELMNKNKTFNSKNSPTVIIATVKGDIHDIGKNILGVMLKNQGIEVIDLGTDVEPSLLLESAQNHQASAIGLSALMTTTRESMKQIVQLKNQLLPSLKIVVGGAAVNRAFAENIGADGYGADAAEGVRIFNQLISNHCCATEHHESNH